MRDLTGKDRTVTPVVTIEKVDDGYWAWDVWWRSENGSGRFDRGHTRTRWGARRAVRKALR